MNAAPDNLHYQCNLSRFFFSSFSHPLVLICFFSFFHFPICFSPSVFAEVIWLVQGKRAVAVVCVQMRQREESHSGGELHSFLGYTTERQHRGADTVKVLCVLVCVYVVVFLLYLGASVK